MNENEMRDVMLKVTSMAVDSLSDDELAGLNMCLVLDNDPRKLPQWDKVKPFFQTNFDPPTMHEETERAFYILFNDRFGE